MQLPRRRALSGSLRCLPLLCVPVSSRVCATPSPPPIPKGAPAIARNPCPALATNLLGPRPSCSCRPRQLPVAQAGAGPGPDRRPDRVIAAGRVFLGSRRRSARPPTGASLASGATGWHRRQRAGANAKLPCFTVAPHALPGRRSCSFPPPAAPRLLCAHSSFPCSMPPRSPPPPPPPPVTALLSCWRR